MVTMEDLSDFLLNAVLDQSERIYYTFCPRGYNARLSREVLAVVLLSMEAEEQAQYCDKLELFARRERSRLEAIYNRYGPVSEAGGMGLFVLLGQPESVAVFERLGTSPMRLEDIWRDRLPEELLAEMHSLW